MMLEDKAVCSEFLGKPVEVPTVRCLWPVCPEGGSADLGRFPRHSGGCGICAAFQQAGPFRLFRCRQGRQRCPDHRDWKTAALCEYTASNRCGIPELTRKPQERSDDDPKPKTL